MIHHWVVEVKSEMFSQSIEKTTNYVSYRESQKELTIAVYRCKMVDYIMQV